jgi:CDP-4-dehydro-6-deoxyglucose reductase
VDTIRVKVGILPSGRSCEAQAGESVLEAALRAGMNLPHSCRGGRCGSCRARLLRGRIEYRRGDPLGLSAAEAADGWILLCQATALTDLVVETREQVSVAEVQVRSLPCRVDRVEPIAAGVMGLWLRWPAVEDFTWRAGQSVELTLPDGSRRRLAIANLPGQGPLIELHVARAPDDPCTEQVFSGLGRGTLLRIEGPLD